MARTAIGWILSLAGAAIGAVVGYVLFRWALSQGFYAMVVPGACLGLGAHLASPTRSTARGVVLGIAALIYGVLVDCKTNLPPFDDVRYYFTHLANVGQISLLMIVVGGVVGFWWGRDRSPWAGRMALQPVNVKGRVEGVDDGAR